MRPLMTAMGNNLSFFCYLLLFIYSRTCLHMLRSMIDLCFVQLDVRCWCPVRYGAVKKSLVICIRQNCLWKCWNLIIPNQGWKMKKKIRIRKRNNSSCLNEIIKYFYSGHILIHKWSTTDFMVSEMIGHWYKYNFFLNLEIFQRVCFFTQYRKFSLYVNI